MAVERRESIRLYPEKNQQVCLTCQAISITGYLYNISASGMAVEYEASCTIDIGKVVIVNFTPDLPDNQWTGNIPCIPVYEILTLAHGQNFSGKQMRQCGMTYGELSPTLRTRIDQMLAGLSGEPMPV